RPRPPPPAAPPSPARRPAPPPAAPPRTPAPAARRPGSGRWCRRTPRRRPGWTPRSPVRCGRTRSRAVLRAYPGAGLAALLAQYPYLVDGGGRVGGLDHVDQGEAGGGDRGQRLHLHAGTVGGL